MWHDLERLCAAQGIGFRKPSKFPRGSILGARIVAANQDAPWIGAFIRAIYTANFCDDVDIGSPSVIAQHLAALDQDADAVLKTAASPTTKAALRTLTDTAIAKGIFGAPTGLVDNELFWGNDRLDAALAQATTPL
jgi:2-hydroxychromene-2-carboxylate isomerase